MPLFVTDHPLIKHKMTKLRDKTTSPHDFRNLLKEITFYLGYEATRSLKSQPIEVTTPMEVKFNGDKLKDKIAIIPVLRAGLGMTDAMLQLMPYSAVHHIGMYRAKDSMLPIQYYNRLPRDESCDAAFILDPCIASCSTIHAVVSILKRWGAKKITVVATIASQEGVDRLMTAHPDVDIYIGAVDQILSEAGMILPGLGDAGDRLFGTPHDEIPSLTPAEPIDSPNAVGMKRKALEKK